MADQQHETVIHRIEAWRVATEAAEQTPDTEALVKERDGLLAELKQEIIDAYEHPTSRERLSLETALADVTLTNRTAEDVLAEVRHAVGVGPFGAVDNDDWHPQGGWPEREWLIPAWLPLGRVGMLSGRGGRGKSRLVLQLAAAVAAKEPRRGVFIPPKGHEDIAVVVGALRSLREEHCGPVVFVSWEDEREEVGRRLAGLAKDELGNQGDELRGRLRFLDLRGVGPLWAPADRSSDVRAPATLTGVGVRVRATVEDLDARLLIIDSLAGAYGGDENVRALVRAFCADWDAWASVARCTVMLIAHPPKTPGGVGSRAEDRDYAGSTDWHAAARWRWTLDAGSRAHRPARAGRQLAIHRSDGAYMRKVELRTAASTRLRSAIRVRHRLERRDGGPCRR